MKNLWKYLSTLGLMFVAFLCLGVGLKAGEKAVAVKTYDVYVASGSSYTMSGGTMHNGVDVSGTFTMNGGTIDAPGTGIDVSGTFTMNGGTITNTSNVYEAIYLEPASPQATMNFVSGTISGGCGIGVETSVCNMRGGTINCSEESLYIDVDGTFNMYGGSILNGVIHLYSGSFNYYGGQVRGVIESGDLITLHKEPENVFNVQSLRTISVGTKIAKLEGISTIDLTKLNVTNLPSDCKLEIQTISGEKWVVVAKEATTTNYTVTISAGTGGSVSRTSVSVPSGTTFSTSGRTLSFSNGTSVTATANTGYSFDYWSPSSGTITSSRTIYAYFSKNQTTTNYTVTISAGSGGRVSQTSVSVPSGTTYTTSGSRLTFSNGTSVTATANSGYTFDYWNPSSGTITSSRTIYAYFTSTSTPTPDPQGEIYVGLDPDRRLTALERAILIVLNNGSTINDAINDGSFEAYMNEVLEIEFGVNGDQAFFEEYGISYKYFEAPRKDIIDSYGVDIYFPLGSINGGTTSIEVSNYRYSYMSSYPGQLVTTSRADVLVIYEGDDPSVLTGSTLTHLSTDMSRACDAVDRFCTYNDVTPDHVYIGSEQALTGTISGLWSMPVAIDSGYLDAADDYTLEDFFNQMRDRGYSWFWLSDEGYDVDWYSFMFLTAEFNNAYGSTIRNDLQYLRYTYPEFASAKWRYLQKGY